MRCLENGVVLQRRMRIVEGVGVIVMFVDKLDMVFAYALSLITAIALNIIPDLNHKVMYLVVSTAIVFVVAFMSSWVEKEVKDVG